MDVYLEDFGRFLEQERRKRATMIELLIHIQRRRLEALPFWQLNTMVREKALAEIDLTQMIDLSPREPTAEQLIEELLDGSRDLLRKQSIERLAEQIDADALAMFESHGKNEV